MDQAECEQTLDHIRGLAGKVIEKLGPLSEIEFGLNRPSVEWVEGFIERQRVREDLRDDVRKGLINTLGAFLGECIISAAGGGWEPRGQEWAIHFDSDTWAYPISKVWKQFDNGIKGGDSILSFYDVAVRYVAPGRLHDLRENGKI